MRFFRYVIKVLIDLYFTWNMFDNNELNYIIESKTKELKKKKKNYCVNN